MATPFHESSRTGANERPLAVVTGASSGIGYDLTRICAENGFDLLVAADQPEIQDAARAFRALGASVDAVQPDLATLDGVDSLYAAAKGRPVEALLANAGDCLGKGSLNQEFDDIRHVIDTNITGTIYLLQKVGATCAPGDVGGFSSPGPLPGSCQAPSRRCTTAQRRSSTRSRSPFGRN